MDRYKIRLNRTNSAFEQDSDYYLNLEFNNNGSELPFDEINRVLNESEQFNNERQSVGKYRILNTIYPLFTNVLHNTTGVNSLGYFNDDKFRDRTFPPNNSLNDDEDLTFNGSVDTFLREKEGWFGYRNPDLGDEDSCTFIDLKPKREDFSFVRLDEYENWDVFITYPALSASTQNDITFNGLLVVQKDDVIVNNRQMTQLITPVKHGLLNGDTVRLSGLGNSQLNGDYNVYKRGFENGDLLDYVFVLDVDMTATNITTNTRIKRVFSGEESKYYFRKFKKVKVNNNDSIKTRVGFSKTVYRDTIEQVLFNSDIDVSDLTDNLGRPLSEIYVTFIKNNNDGLFTTIKSGLEIPFISNLNNFTNVPDIHRIHNGNTTPIQTHTPLETNVNINFTEFFGDVVEYNRLEVREKVLGEVNYRFNTNNRENGGNIIVDGSAFNMGQREEGYYYKAHHKMKIRQLSTYIEQGDETTDIIPEYAEDLSDGRFLWRDVLDIGYSDDVNELLDYPFLNGHHYLYNRITFQLKRQDPFGVYGLYYSEFPRDPFGLPMDDVVIVNRGDNVC